MSYQEIMEPYNQEVEERYPLVMERLEQMLTEETVEEPFRSFFRQGAAFIMQLHHAEQRIREGTFFDQTLEQLQQ